jgi:uncharacterized membrane protein
MIVSVRRIFRALVLTGLAGALVTGCRNAAPAPEDDTGQGGATDAAIAIVASPSVAVESPRSGPGHAGTVAADTLALPARLRATGTEPFWGVDIDGTALTYSTPDFPAGTKITVTRRAGPDFVEFAGTLDGKPLTLRIVAGPCSDGMSDRVYPYAVTREIGPDIERGCARGR